MCNNCQQDTDNCIEVITPKCDVGCPDIINTGCVFHNGEMPFLGITKGASLSFMLKALNKYITQNLYTDFTSFNMHDLNSVNEIKNIKQFVEAVTGKIKDTVSKVSENTILIGQLENVIDDLNSSLLDINIVGVSDTLLSINDTDTIKQVLEKIIDYLDNLPIAVNYQFKESQSIEFSESGSEVLAAVKISEDIGNKLKLQPDGLYITDPSISTILNSIKGNSELLQLFKSLVNLNLPCFRFDILSTSNQTISYVNCNGSTVVETVKTNVLLQLTDVRRINTTPNSGLTITFKGI